MAGRDGGQGARPTLHLVCGLPASGKSTLARMIERELGAVRFTPDEWIGQLDGDGRDAAFRQKVEELQWVIAHRLLTGGMSVVVENGFWLREERERYRREARGAGARAAIHLLDIPLKVLKARSDARNERRSDASFLVTHEDLEAWAKEFEAPCAQELAAWDRHSVYDGEIDGLR